MQPVASNRSSSSGFSMIELLVAVLVMGIGVLGIAGLQMVSLQNNRGALERAEAVQLGYDILDRIRANPGSGAVLGIAYDGIDIGGAPPGFVDCLNSACTAGQMVSYDVSIWKCSLGGWDADQACLDARAAGAMWDASVQPGLPSGDGSIAVDGGTGQITVTVQWQPANSAGPVNITLDSQG